jgi:ketosteroid isomerase-like protein
MKTVNQKLSEEFSKGNFEFAFHHFAEDIEWNVVGASVIKGKEAVIAHCKKMLEEMAGSVLINTKHTVGEDSIATEGYCDYSNDGKPGRVEYCDVYKFDGEKLQEITSYYIEIKKE